MVGLFLVAGELAGWWFVDWFGVINSVVLVSFYDFYSLLFNLFVSMFALVLSCFAGFLMSVRLR